MVDCYRCYYNVQLTSSGGQPPDTTQAQRGVDALYNTCRAQGNTIPVSVDGFTLPGQDVNRDTVDRGSAPGGIASTSVAPRPTPQSRSTITVVVDPTAISTVAPNPTTNASNTGRARSLQSLSWESLTVLVSLVSIVAIAL
ncbi:hypothetical protein CVT24_012602 [Panaeolus cyanescens]|uniref:Uncharacterized protein n=1 Tax=Panaeolus cyanescens TaxID=181874 RepID=A0A409YJY0_9AGAR|nr:hypothetical protein CVT24_012602 [Panaeolus cyanescens]